MRGPALILILCVLIFVALVVAENLGVSVIGYRVGA